MTLLNRAIAFLNRVVLIVLALLALPVMLVLKVLYLFRRRPQAPDGAAAVKDANRKVLIIQSADPVHVLKAVEYLDGLPGFQDSHRTVFCRNRPDILECLTGHPGLHQLIPHLETQGWWEHFDRFRKEHFDAVVVFFTGDPSYWKIKYFAFCLGARQKLIFDENNRCLFFSGETLIALLERDLFGCGILKSSPRLCWLAEKYTLVRGGTPSPDSHKIEGKDAGDVLPEEHDTGTEPVTESPDQELNRAKDVVSRLSKTALAGLLSSKARLRLPNSPEPEVSVILVLFNRAELTFRCLRSLADSGCDSVEIIIVDNNSSDETGLLLDRVDGAIILRNSENLHFLKAANAGAARARGRYILMLNNDAEVLPGSIRAAVGTLESSKDIGAVGAKLILPNGRLQEAGSIVWQDGSCLGYGRQDDPFSAEYMFRRDVDYCSGAFLLTRRETFGALGGFDEAYQPFYYEETDFCLRLWERGLRVVFEPEAAVLHYEFASSLSSEEAQKWQSKHQGIFLERHRDRLERHYVSDGKNILLARDVPKERYRVLFIEDRVPHPSLGSGFPRSNTILSFFVKSGFFVTLYLTAGHSEQWRDVYADIPREVEVMLGFGRDSLEQFLQSRADYYDLVLISRPHNMQLAKPILQAYPDWSRKTKIVYDAEALFTFRDVALQKLRGREFSNEEIETLVESEVDLAAEADLVISVSRVEAEEFRRHGIPNVGVLGHAIAVSPGAKPFEDRRGFLFVGSILEENSPNHDAVLWFIKEIMPIIQSRLGPVPLTVAGINNVDFNGMAGSCLKLPGRVADLSALYDEARVFIAPTRFAAGIPHKIHEAASRGLPVVATSLLKNQLEWTDNMHLLVGDEPQEFAERCICLYTDEQLWHRIRRNGLDQVRAECAPEAFESKLRSILEQVKQSAQTKRG
jgi:GT2 family glycosyltransferase